MSIKNDKTFSMSPAYTGMKIYELRRKKGLTQKELAEQIHVTDKTVSRWETGKNFPDLEMLEAVADALDTNVPCLLGLEIQGYGEPEEHTDQNPEENLSLIYANETPDSMHQRPEQGDGTVTAVISEQKNRIRLAKLKKRILWVALFILIIYFIDSMASIVYWHKDIAEDQEENITSDPYADVISRGYTEVEIDTILDGDDMKIYTVPSPSGTIAWFYTLAEDQDGEWHYDGRESYADGVYYDASFYVSPYHTEIIDTEGQVYQPACEIECEDGYLPIFAFNVDTSEADENGILLTALVYGVDESGEIHYEPDYVRFDIQALRNADGSMGDVYAYSNEAELSKTAAGSDFLNQYKVWINDLLQQDTVETSPNYLNDILTVTTYWPPCYVLEMSRERTAAVMPRYKTTVISLNFSPENIVTIYKGNEDGTVDVVEKKRYYINVDLLTAAKPLTESLLTEALKEIPLYQDDSSADSYFSYVIDKQSVYHAQSPSDLWASAKEAFEE